MVDRISSLPDTLLCHILSFVPTKKVVATSVLSKRWLPLWRSVPTLDFDFDDADYDGSETAYARFVQSVYAVILSRDPHQPIQKFRLNCCSQFYDPIHVSILGNAALQRRVQNFDLSLDVSYLLPPPNLSSIFSCKTLVVLKLEGANNRRPISSVEWPFLKVLHLQGLSLAGCGCLAELLSGCPIVEDFKAKDLCFQQHVTDKEFRILPKLLKAHISARFDNFLFEAVTNVKFLHIDRIDCSLGNGTDPCVFPMYHNLNHLELVYISFNHDWSEVVELLNYCPKLQVLVINQSNVLRFESDLHQVQGTWKYPPSVPKCILLHLKTCSLSDYRGTKGEFHFARYIMRKGRFLKRMAISSGMDINPRRKLELLKKLSSCMRRSATCKLSFN